MKYLLLFLSLLIGEAVFSTAIPVQENKVYVIHKERRPFIKKPARRYLRHKMIKKRIENHRKHQRIVAPRHK